jgi:hypothetical protein
MAAYNGMRPITHRIARGETLESIAKKYKFRHWKPIWLYNTKVRKVLGPNPDLITPGIDIIIPRSERGYDNWLGKLHVLKNKLESVPEQEMIKLEKNFNLLKAQDELLNFAGQVLTFMAGLGVRSGKALRAVSKAEMAGGREVPALTYHADKRCAELGEFLRDGLKDEVFDLAIDSTGSETLKDAHKVGKTATKAGRSISRATLQQLRSVVDIGDMIVDHAEPTAVARGMMWILAIPSPEDATKDARSHLVAQQRHSVKEMTKKIEKVIGERQLIYGS